jgi:ABC-type nitrate/sulfonate/bicarbonate transport system substrate-binding protein
MPASAMLAALSAARIDGFGAAPPWTTDAVSAGAAIRLASSPQGDLPELTPFAHSLLVTRPQVCEQRRLVCQKIVRGYLTATRVLRLNKPWAFETLRRRFDKISEAALTDAIDTVSQGTPRIPIVSVIGIENSELFNLRAGVLKREDALLDYGGLYTNEFLH